MVNKVCKRCFLGKIQCDKNAPCSACIKAKADFTYEQVNFNNRMTYIKDDTPSKAIAPTVLRLPVHPLSTLPAPLMPGPFGRPFLPYNPRDMSFPPITWTPINAPLVPLTHSRPAPVLLNDIPATGQTYGRISTSVPPGVEFPDFIDFMMDFPEGRFMTGRPVLTEEERSEMKRRKMQRANESSKL
ncbi:hypothetical protein E4T42_02095 [Aureobasidium subglaciale]|nr:hypothetical protein E4T42_02095 [Aureobasidium subglaciale]